VNIKGGDDVPQFQKVFESIAWKEASKDASRMAQKADWS
jgi:hypothetical protein